MLVGHGISGRFEGWWGWWITFDNTQTGEHVMGGGRTECPGPWRWDDALVGAVLWVKVECWPHLL